MDKVLLGQAMPHGLGSRVIGTLGERWTGRVQSREGEDAGIGKERMQVVFRREEREEQSNAQWTTKLRVDASLCRAVRGPVWCRLCV